MANEASDVRGETSIASLPGTHEVGPRRGKVCHQVYHLLEADSMAASHGDEINAEGVPEKLNRLDEVLKRLVVVKVLDRIGPEGEPRGAGPPR